MEINKIFPLSTGLQYSKPEILKDFIPIEFEPEKTILINTSVEERKPSKAYSYWQLVVDFLSKELPDYKIVQISDGKQSALNNCAKHYFDLTPNQAAYLIQNCCLLITPDHLYSFIMGDHGLPNSRQVILYGSTHPDISKPNGYNKIVLTGFKSQPSYQANETPKVIDNIRPENVVSAALDSLFANKITSLKTLFVGRSFTNSTIEVVPDAVITDKLFPGHHFNVRMDYLHDEQTLAKMLSVRPYNIVCNKEIDIGLVKKFKSRILTINFEVDGNTSLEYCWKLKHSGVKPVFFSRLTGDALKELRFRMLDLGFVESLEIFSKPTELEGVKSARFKTNKFLLSGGKIYLSPAHWKEGLNTEKFLDNEGEIIDNQSFWQDQGYYYVFQT